MYNITNKINVVLNFVKNSYTIENIFLYFLAKKSYKKYHFIDFTKIRQYIKDSDTVVIYGTGRSILNITEEQWKELKNYNSISIGSFAQYNKFINIDINHFREIGSYNFIYKDSRIANWEEMINYAKNINHTAYFSNCIHLFQSGIPANASNRFIYSELLEYGTKYSNYKSTRKHKNKLIEKETVLSHLNGSLGEAINLAYQLKWKNIILAGIDLKDRRYFYLNESETSIWDICRNKKASNKHNMAESTLKNIQNIQDQLKRNGINLYIVNKNSLLADILPTYDFKE